jgi:hypothetical protein
MVANMTASAADIPLLKMVASSMQCVYGLLSSSGHAIPVFVGTHGEICDTLCRDQRCTCGNSRGVKRAAVRLHLIV